MNLKPKSCRASDSPADLPFQPCSTQHLREVSPLSKDRYAMSACRCCELVGTDGGNSSSTCHVDQQKPLDITEAFQIAKVLASMERSALSPCQYALPGGPCERMSKICCTSPCTNAASINSLESGALHLLVLGQDPRNRLHSRC